MSGDKTKKSAGAPLQIAAETWNELLDTIDFVRQLREGNRASSGLNVNHRGVEILVWNNTLTDVPRFGIMGSKQPYPGSPSPIVLDTANADEFHNRPGLVGRVPKKAAAAYTDGTDKILIAQEPIKAGKYGRCVVDGFTPVLINVTDLDHKYADVKDGDVTQLASASSGPFEIFYKPFSTGTGKECFGSLSNNPKNVLLADAAAADGWLSSPGYDTFDSSEEIRSSATAFATIGGTKTVYNLGRYGNTGHCILLSNNGEWLGIPTYDNGLTAAVQGELHLDVATATAGSWATPTPNLDPAGLMTSVSSSALTLKYAGYYTFDFVFLFDLNDDLTTFDMSGNPDKPITGLTVTLPAATSGTVTWRGLPGGTGTYAHAMPAEAAFNSSCAFRAHAEVTQGVVLEPPKFTQTQLGSGKDMDISYYCLITGASGPLKIA